MTAYDLLPAHVISHCTSTDLAAKQKTGSNVSDERTDQQWLDALRSHDSARQVAAYSDLFQLLRRRVYGYLHQRRTTIPALDGLDAGELEELAADYAQDALLRIWERLDDYRGTGKFTNWAFVIAVNIAAESFRRRRWFQEIPTNRADQTTSEQQEIEDDGPRPEQLLLLQSFLDDMAAHLDAHLSTREQTAFSLKYLCRWPAQRIQAALNALDDHAQPATLDAVHQALQRARKKLASALRADGYTVEDVVDLPEIVWQSARIGTVPCPDKRDLDMEIEAEGQIIRP